MRRHGAVTSAAALGPFAHLAWGYRQQSEFFGRAAEYIADGLAQNHWILYSRDGSVDTLRNELVAMGFADAVRAGQIFAKPVGQHYRFVPGTDVVDPEPTVAEGVSALQRAVGLGCSGCRAVVDAAVLLRTPEQRAAFSRLEYLVDQKMTELPYAALCAYNLSLLGDNAKELMCLHPFVGGEEVGFRIYADRGADFALAGEVDAADNGTFITAVQRIWPLSTGDELVIDAHGLDFITHNQLVALDRLGSADDRQVVLLSDQPMVVRLAALLNLAHVRVQAPPPLADAS